VSSASLAVVFSVDAQGFLVKDALPRRGRPYKHRCRLSDFEAIAHAIDDAAGEPWVGEQMAAAEDVPYSAAAVAIGFLLERGCIERVGRQNVAASGCVHLDGMIEFEALRSAERLVRLGN